MDVHYLTATEALRQFQNRTLSPVELMSAVIARSETAEPVINAFSFTCFEEAMDKAKAAEKRYQDGTARPLEGIPVAVKDESYIKGQVTTNGCLLLKDFVATTTSFVIQRLLDAGAIVHARTTTPEFSVAVFTWSKLWGVTRNPWNPAMTPFETWNSAGALI
jgi:Asp-tRNA(Asn)/Glu-tRNA(Gln) amidotransferase A subunit family amidase